MTLFEFINSWQVGLTAVALFAITNQIKAAFGGRLENSILKRALPFIPVLLGTVVGLIPGWLPANTLPTRMVCGALVGACTPMIYGVLKKRLPRTSSPDSESVKAGVSQD